MIWETQVAIRAGLRVLARPSYFAAMWILCGELRSLYTAWVRDTDGTLMTTTMDLVRDAAVGDEPAGMAGRAAQVASEWDLLVIQHQDEVPIGLSDTWEVFRGLAMELAGTATRDRAIDSVTSAAPERKEILATFCRVVDKAGEERESVRDPAKLRAEILGAEPS